jgi:hypothetical protein
MALTKMVSGWLLLCMLEARRRDATGEETGAKRTGTMIHYRVGRIGTVVSPILRQKLRIIEARQVTRKGSCWGSGYENAEKANGGL